MARRRITDIPTSRLAVWARRVALFALATAMLGTLIVRAGLLEIEPALATVAGAFVLAAVAILLAIGGIAVIWKDGLEGFGSALAGLAIGLALLAYPGYLASKAYYLPAITDITTDTTDPPKLEALARIRPREGGNPVDYPGEAVAEKQLDAYPDVEPLQLAVPPAIAYEAIYTVITKRKWRIVEARRPQPRRDGHIEAVARTPIMGFRDDVVVRIRADSDGTRVDVRSSSRYGLHDFGTNAERIVAFLADVDAAVDALPAEPSPQEAKPPAARR